MGMSTPWAISRAASTDTFMESELFIDLRPLFSREADNGAGQRGREYVDCVLWKVGVMDWKWLLFDTGIGP